MVLENQVSCHYIQVSLDLKNRRKCEIRVLKFLNLPFSFLQLFSFRTEVLYDSELSSIDILSYGISEDKTEQVWFDNAISPLS